MSSKSNAVDKTSQTTSTNVVDRKAVQQQGLQILDSIVYSPDDKVIAAAMGEVRSMLMNMSGSNAVTVSNLLGAIDKIAGMANKNQLDISRFSMQALEGARRDLKTLADAGHVVLELADESVGRAIGLAERITSDQSRHQSEALQIIAEAKTGDYADTLKQVSGMVMGFTLLALVILRKS